MDDRHCDYCGLLLDPASAKFAWMSRQHGGDCQEAVRTALAAARLQGWREGREAAAKWYFDQATQLDSDTEWVCSAIRALPEPDYSEEE
jgi:hypothetical protein